MKRRIALACPAAEAAPYFAWHVLTMCGRDPEITRLLDSKALYVRVKNNPGGSELYLHTARTNGSPVRPHDGDGYCLQMRQRAEDGKGEFILVKNEGAIPTALETARRIKIAKPDRVEIKLTGNGPSLAG